MRKVMLFLIPMVIFIRSLTEQNNQRLLLLDTIISLKMFIYIFQVINQSFRVDKIGMFQYLRKKCQYIVSFEKYGLYGLFFK